MNLQAVVQRRFAPVEQAWDARDTALYGLSLGLGSNPLDPRELPFVYEGPRGDGLRALPTLAMTLAWPAFWQDEPALAIDWVRIVHGEQHVRWHRPLPAAGRVIGRHRLRAVQDKGAGRGAVLHLDTELEDAQGGQALASIRQVHFLRGDGGCGHWGEAPPGCEPLAEQAQPDEVVELATPPQAALLYRLASRDLMPIHADPAVAREAGFPRPILHGLNTLGLAARAILWSRLGRAPDQPDGAPDGAPDEAPDAARLRALSARFVQPGLPGDTVRVELFRGTQGLRFRARAVERGVLLLDRGSCELG